MRYLTLALAISSASALAVTRPYSPSTRRLFARQAAVLDPDEVPDQCTQQCTPVLTDAQNCATGDSSCICKAQVASDYQGCVNCIFDAAQGNPTFVQIAQTAANVFNGVCSQAGITVASVTVPAFGAQPTQQPGQQQPQPQQPPPPPPPQNTAPPAQSPQGGNNGVDGTSTDATNTPPPPAATSVASTVAPVITQPTAPVQNSVPEAIPQTSGTAGVPSVASASPSQNSGAIRDMKISHGVAIILVGVITHWLI